MRELRVWVKKMGGPNEVAKLLGVAPQSVRYWMRGGGRPKFNLAHKIHLKSKISLDKLMNIGR